uniref:Uncharacterized protein n=1 Tax=Glossina pallidipes TaxID=7398 RepID=A0A1A9ZJG8_GLOPL
MLKTYLYILILIFGLSIVSKDYTGVPLNEARFMNCFSDKLQYLTLISFHGVFVVMLLPRMEELSSTTLKCFHQSMPKPMIFLNKIIQIYTHTERPYAPKIKYINLKYSWTQDDM